MKKLKSCLLLMFVMLFTSLTVFSEDALTLMNRTNDYVSSPAFYECSFYVNLDDSYKDTWIYSYSNKGRLNIDFKGPRRGPIITLKGSKTVTLWTQTTGSTGHFQFKSNYVIEDKTAKELVVSKSEQLKYVLNLYLSSYDSVNGIDISLNAEIPNDSNSVKNSVTPEKGTFSEIIRFPKTSLNNETTVTGCVEASVGDVYKAVNLHSSEELSEISDKNKFSTEIFIWSPGGALTFTPLPNDEYPKGMPTKLKDGTVEKATDKKDETDDILLSDDSELLVDDVNSTHEETFEEKDIDYEAEANALNKLGLFNGTDNGYDLDNTFTRAQGATMLVRLLGATTLDTKPIFDDVSEDHWANPYISYCYKNKIVNGTSETTFTPEREMTCEEYLTLILRSLGYANVSPDTAVTAAAGHGLLTSEKLNEIAEKEAFKRDDMVHISYNSLNIKGANNKTILDNLLAESLITQPQYESEAKQLP